MNKNNLLGKTWSTIEDRKEEFEKMGGIDKIIACLTDISCSNKLKEQINIEQLNNAIYKIREQFAEALGVAECSGCGELHKIEELHFDSYEGKYICKDCAFRFGENICVRCGQICNTNCYLCDECVKEYDFCEQCETIHKIEEFKDIIRLKDFDFEKRTFNGYTTRTCSNCYSELSKHDNTMLNDIQCRIYIFDESENIKFASKENSKKFMNKFTTKNGTFIHYLYSSLISKKENEECLRYFIKHASPKAIQQALLDKENIIEIIGEEAFRTIFKGNLL